MNVGKSYRLPEFLRWTRRKLYLLVALSSLPVLLVEYAGWQGLAIPWVAVAVLGTATSFIVGFKNAQTYQRTVEAQQVWTSIAASSRYWGLICRDFPVHGDQARALTLRHLAWLTALRYQLRSPRPWETARSASNAEYGKTLIVAERQTPLSTALRPYLSDEELAEITDAPGKATRLLSLQSEAIRALYTQQQIVVLHHTEMQKTIKDLLDQQSRAERIKNFPYPRQYAIVNSIFVWSFAALLPFGLAAEFARAASSFPAISSLLVTCLAIPFSVLISWLYVALDQVGESTENPFEGAANDVPITQICLLLENELRTMLGEVQTTRLTRPVNHIIL
ncbi:bestrophin family ion channel [Ramlibacter sp. PS3R-8]|uniref:bestrophin family protein n=1 Tax=Ramlibacter sp. PS3R-8 TaxID=3133437 RepID=UPI0030AE6BA8